jgi:hypothetical protein
MIIQLDPTIIGNLTLLVNSLIDYFGLLILVFLILRPYLWDEYGGDL